MTPEQATEIRKHLIEQLNIHGFSDIVIEINTRLEEDYEEKGFRKDPKYLLDFFLAESNEILNNLSHNNYQELISRFNKINSGENRIDRISVELLDSGDSSFFDLYELPNYNKITEVFEDIRSEIEREN